MREADVVIDATYETASALHNAFESHGCTAFWEGDSLTLWDSTQAVFVVRGQVAEKLGLPESRVRGIFREGPLTRERVIAALAQQTAAAEGQP